MEASKLAETFIAHYQKTAELNLEIRNERNRLFLILVGVIALASILTFKIQQTDSLLVDIIAKILNISGANSVLEFHKSFPLGLLQSILLVIILYLMVNLYHRSVHVLLNYRYLGELEKEIRNTLGLEKNTIAFTKESSFYWDKSPKLLNSIKCVYILLLGSLLGAFLWGKITEDLQSNVILLITEILISFIIVVFYIGYVTSSLGLGRKIKSVKQFDIAENHKAGDYTK